LARPNMLRLISLSRSTWPSVWIPRRMLCKGEQQRDRETWPDVFLMHGLAQVVLRSPVFASPGQSPGAAASHRPDLVKAMGRWLHREARVTSVSSQRKL
jgi:hypothetical protein